MQAWFLTGPGAIELRDVPDPQPGPHEAVVRVEAVGICGSDAECFAGKHPLPNYPRLPGHEFSGVVAAVGSAWEGVPVGTRVAADPAISCGRCYACRQGRHNCCVDVSIAGVHRPGTMAGYTLCREPQLHPMPDGMSFEAAALVETLSIGAQAVHRGGVKAEDRVVILGGGPIGLCALVMARHAGAGVLLAEPLAWRLALAEDLGAEVCVNPVVDSVADAVQEFTGGYGAHVVVDATGEPSAAESSLTLVGSAGRVVILTLSEEPIRVRPWQLVRQELTILGSRLTLADLTELLALAASGEAPLERLATHRYAFADAESAFRVACERPEGLVKAVVLPHT